MPPTFTSHIKVNFEKQKLFAIRATSATSAEQRYLRWSAQIAVDSCPAIRGLETALFENRYSGHWRLALLSAI